MSGFSILIVALILARGTVSLGYRLRLVDHPDARKQHSGAVPLTGGIAIFITILAGTFALDITPYTRSMLAITCAVFLVGVFDDFRHIRASTRLLIQYGSGILLATYGGIAIHNVGDLLAVGDIHLLMLTAPLTALAVAGLCNAYNMIDGIDGLAAATISLPLLVLYVLALWAGHPMADTLLLMHLPLGVFLLFNLGPNNPLMPKIFLGDGGSITLGFMVSASLVYFSQGDTALIKPVTALWLVALPLMDMLATMLRRLQQDRPLMRADRSHLHHTLLDLGLGPRWTLLLLLGWSGLCAGAGLALEAAPAYISMLCYFLVFGAHCALVTRLDRTEPYQDTERENYAVDARSLERA